MIIVNIIGGLGNQLSQYALGRRLSLLNNTELFLDISGYKTYKLHDYGLNNFNIFAKIARPDNIIKIKGYRYYLNKLLEKISHGKLYIANEHIINEKSYEYDPQIINVGNNVYLSGYWANEQYFFPIRDVLLKDLTLKSALSAKSKEVLNHINNSMSVSLHVRRGDYLTTAKSTHGILSLDYYQDAIDGIKRHVNNPCFYIFSDDKEWVKENISISDKHIFVDHNGKDKNYEDFYLMSQCQHHINANSSFSWWAAWLGNNPDKIVIAPKRLFADNNIDQQCQGGIPESWIRV